MNAKSRTASDRSKVQSVQRAVAVLDVLTDSRSALSATEITNRTKLERTVVHRLLRTLVDGDLVDKQSGRYGLGPRAILYGNAYLDRLTIRRAALPYLSDFHIRSIGSKPWALTLGVPALREVLLVERLWNRYAPLDTLIEIGTTFQFDSSVLGRSMLAFMSEEEVTGLVGPEKAAELRPKLGEIKRREGIEYSSSELKPGISAIAAAVVLNDAPIGAVAVSGPRLEDELSGGSDLAIALKRLATQVASAKR